MISKKAYYSDYPAFLDWITKCRMEVEINFVNYSERLYSVSQMLLWIVNPHQQEIQKFFNDSASVVTFHSRLQTDFENFINLYTNSE